MINDMTDPSDPSPLLGFSDEALLDALLHTSVDLDGLDLPQYAAREEPTPSSCARTEDSLQAVLLDLDLHQEAALSSDATEGSASTRSDESPARVVRVMSDEDCYSYDSGSSGGGRKRRREDVPLDPEEKKNVRMARNRASAAASRERKKAQMADLQSKIDYLLQHNQSLSCSMQTLQVQHAQLRQENKRLKASLSLQKEQQSTTTTYEPKQQTYFHKSAALDDSPQMEFTLFCQGSAVAAALLFLWLSACRHTEAPPAVSPYRLPIKQRASLKQHAIARGVSCAQTQDRKSVV